MNDSSSGCKTVPSIATESRTGSPVPLKHTQYSIQVKVECAAFGEFVKYLYCLLDYITAAGLITPVTAPPLPTPYYFQSLSPLTEHPSNTVEYSPDAKPTQPAQPDQPLGKAPKKPLPPPIDGAGGHICRNGDTYATSFCRQLSLLILRTFLNMWRDRSLTLMRLFIHCCIGLLIGTMFVGIGNDAANVRNIFGYIFFSIMFTMFTAFSSMTLVCKCAA